MSSSLPMSLISMLYWPSVDLPIHYIKYQIERDYEFWESLFEQETFERCLKEQGGVVEWDVQKRGRVPKALDGNEFDVSNWKKASSQ